MYIDNAWYGHKKIILNYLNLRYQPILDQFSMVGSLKIEQEKQNMVDVFNFSTILCWKKKIETIIKK